MEYIIAKCKKVYCRVTTHEIVIWISHAALIKHNHMAYVKMRLLMKASY